MHVQEKCIIFIANSHLCCILYATVHASVCTHLASSADWVKSNMFCKTQIVQYLKLDTWCRCQWEIWSNHPHNAAILTAQRTIPHWNQLKCTMTQTRQKHNVTTSDLKVHWFKQPADTSGVWVLQNKRMTQVRLCTYHVWRNTKVLQDDAQHIKNILC